VGGKLTQVEVSRTVDFCLNAFQETTPEQRQKVLDRVKSVNGNTTINMDNKEDLEKFTPEELEILNSIRAKQMLRMEDTFNLNHFGKDSIEGFAPNLVRGSLGLVPAGKEDSRSKLEAPVVDLLSLVDANETVETMRTQHTVKAY
jgi:flavine halogenase